MWNDKVLIKLGVVISVLAVVFMVMNPPVGWLLAYLAYFIGLLLALFPQTFPRGELTT